LFSLLFHPFSLLNVLNTNQSWIICTANAVGLAPKGT